MKLNKAIFLFSIVVFLNIRGYTDPNSRLWNELNSQLIAGSPFKTYDIIHKVTSASPSFYNISFPKANFWTLNPEAIKKILNEQTEFLSFDVEDFEQNKFQLLLVRQNIYSEHSRVLTSEDPTQEERLSQGIHFRGIVKDHPGSLVALSVYEDQLIAVLSLTEKGNMILGKLKSTNPSSENELPHVLYYENDLPGNSGFQCGTEDMIPNGFTTLLSSISPDSIYSNHCKTTKVFLECDFRLYQDYNNQKNQVVNFISGLFNVVKTLYYNEYINIEISDIMVWTTQDPFLHTDLQSIIFHYTNYRKMNFNGDLAQLVTTFPPQQQGGIAWLGTLCQGYNGQSGPHSFAYIYNSYNILPAYSWSVEVMTHEMGHNFGSPHTHACFWGPNRNMALDNCQPPENNGCAPGPAPIGGGTIMSYCHLTGNGINFSNGFGLEPGNLIRTSVESKSCLSPQFVPTITPNLAGPYFEGDTIILKARPGKSTYNYDWFHYDYKMLSPKDSILRPDYSGVYKVAISDRCTEYSVPDTVKISDFFVNLGCPVIPGFRDSFVVSVNMIADQGTRRDSLIFPDSLYQKIPSYARDVMVEMQMKIEPQGSSWTRDVTSAYQSPTNININNNRYNPNATEPAQFNGVKTYVKLLGNFNPKGKWYFTTNDNKFDNGIDAKVRFSIVLSWRSKDSVASCDIPLCNGMSRKFDAGIRNAKYKWSTGETTKIIMVNKPGPLSVEVTKNKITTKHAVTIYNYPTNYQQNFTICNGDTVKVGKKNYTKSGIYIDTLRSFNACDSIIETTLNVLDKKQSSEDQFICYADSFMGFSFVHDTILHFPFVSIEGCDSTHTINLKVNPPIRIQALATPACPEIGGSLEAIASGGTGMDYQFKWSNGDSSAKTNHLTSGIYNVIVSDSFGCRSDQDFELINLDSVSLVPTITDVSCFGGKDGKINVDIQTGTAPFIFNWSNGETTKDIFDLPAGQYTIFVRDFNGCLLQKVIEIGSPELLFLNLDIKGSTGIDGSAKANISGGTAPYFFLWSTGENGEEISGLTPGDYWIKVTDKNGCEITSQFKVQQLIATKETEFSKIFNIYPIPLRNQLVVEINSNDLHQHNMIWNLRDVHTRIINSGLFLQKSNQLLMTEMPSGVYILEIQENDKIYRKVLIKD